MPGDPWILASLAVIEEDKKILLVRESAAPCRGKWSLPGGRALPGESILQTAVREIREETGIAAELTGLLYIDQMFDEGGGRIRFVFAGRAAGGGLKQIEDEHSLRAGWFDDEEAGRLDLRSPFMRKIIGLRRANPAGLPIGRIHVFTPEDYRSERP
ncbi:MAG: NUDIX domain-containing protein [Anaerolineales bacterium]|nr:NUDIX domain-containing protein [Anaerolineales bacterium]